MNYIAHVSKDEGSPGKEPHGLEDHLYKVARLARSSIRCPHSARWAELSGLWHDLGKYQAGFQKYIRENSGYEAENAHLENVSSKRIPHSTAGAVHAIKTLGPGYGHILAYLIAGHHAGLPDWLGGKGSLNYRLEHRGEKEYIDSLKSPVPEDILQTEPIELPAAIKNDPMALSLWMRMLFSALVDADFLDTERYMNPEQASQRSMFPSIETLRQSYDQYMAQLRRDAPETTLQKIRHQVYQACLSSAVLKPGIFSLTVPTGGGKTLSSLGFALEHARRHKKKRIIYAIPFTSIIEQNAGVFRQCLGSEAVLEHHSNLDVIPDQENAANRLAAENWDASLIVTTNVQLFESLHASRPSRCRKLHNLQDSIIILDEAQQLPRDFHAPIVRSMKQLSDYFGVTWVLCTATQPDLSSQQSLFGKNLLKGLDAVHEIYPAPEELASQLKRVQIELPESQEAMSWEHLARVIQSEDCVLVIVNTRSNARELYQLLEASENNFHLSANLCAEQRSNTLSDIKFRLENKRKGRDKRSLRVISTQLVEAGVDLDFPVVFRAMAGLDSIAQSAGRCNREGKLNSAGRVVVFNPPKKAPTGFLRQAQQITEIMLASGQLDDPLSPQSFREFFRQLNQEGSRDRQGINELLTPQGDAAAGGISLQFREAARRFRMIDDNGVSIIVPYIPPEQALSPVVQWLGILEADSSQKWVYKKLQRYTITLPESLAIKYQSAGMVDTRAGQLMLLECYLDPVLGIKPPDSLLAADETII